MMLNIKYGLPLILSLFLIETAAAQQRLSLDSILKQIDRNNLTLKAFNSRSQSLSAKAGGAAAWSPSMIGVGNYMTPYPWDQNPASDKGSFMISVQQDIPNPAKINRKKAYQQSLSAVEQEARNNSFNNLRNQARKLYYQWLITEKKQNLVEENRHILNTLHKLVEIRYAYNKSALSDIYTIEARLSQLDNDAMELESDRLKKMYDLNTLMNRPAGTAFDIDTSLVVLPVEMSLIDTAYLSNSRSIIRQMDKNIKAMNLNAEAMKAEAKPDFSIRFDHMATRNPMMPAQYTAMAMISIPIAPWSSKSYQSEVKSMKLSINAMQNERQAMLLETQNMLQSMMSDLMTMEHHLTNYKRKIIPAFKKSFDASQIAYEENQSQLMPVLQAWGELNSVRMKYLNELQSYYLMQADYEREIEK